MERLLRLGVFLFFALGAAGQEQMTSAPATKQDIEKLFVAMHIRERMEILIADSRKQSRIFLANYLLKQVPGASEKQDQVQAMVDEMLDGIFKEYPIDAILNDTIPIYQKHLSEPDVDAIVAFYSTPVGQKVLHELPAILSESSQITQSRLQPRLQDAAAKLTERLTRMIEEDPKLNSK